MILARGLMCFGAIGLATVPVGAQPSTASPSVGEPAHSSVAGTARIGLMGPAVRVTDIEASLRFYRDGLGMTVLHQLTFDDVQEVILAFGAEPSPPFLFLLHHSGDVGESGQGSGEKIVLTVSDAAAVSAQLVAAGFAPDPIRGHGNNGTVLFWATDPNGQRFEIIERQLPYP